MAQVMKSVLSARMAYLLANVARAGAAAGPTACVAGQPQRAYHKNVVDHYENPRNVGSFDKNDKNVGTGLVGAPACGDVMKLQIKVDDDGNIVDSCFKTFGCGSAIASSSVATEWYVKEAFGSPAVAVIVGIVRTLCTAAALEHALCRKTTCARGVPAVIVEHILFFF